MAKTLLIFFVLFAVGIFSCSSDSSNSEALNEWFNSQGIATSYGEASKTDQIYLKDAIGVSVNRVFDSSAYLLTTFGALGNANGIEQMLHFGIETADSLNSSWLFRLDSVFYADTRDSSKFPLPSRNLKAKFYWLKESAIYPDSSWLKFSAPFTDSADVEFEWKAKKAADTFYIELPKELSSLRASNSSDTLRLSVAIKLLDETESEGEILRITAPLLSEINGLVRVAQKARITENCPTCLYSGIRDSLKITFSASNLAPTGKTVVFAQLLLPKNGDADSDTSGSELGLPVPIFVYSPLGLENYRVDTSFVKENGHPNILFWNGTDTLKLQVTNALRHFEDGTPRADSLQFTFYLGVPMLDPKSLYFYNSEYSGSKVFASRPAYSRYDFGNYLKNDMFLRLYLANFSSP